MLTRQKQSAELLAAIKEYDANKWKVVGQKVGKPAKVRWTCASKKRHTEEATDRRVGMRAVREGTFRRESLTVLFAVS